MAETPELHKGIRGAIPASDRPRLLTQASAPGLLALGANKEPSLPSRPHAPAPGVGSEDDNNSGSYHAALWVALVLFIVVGVLALFWLWRRRQQASINRNSQMTGTELVGNSATTERHAARRRLASSEFLEPPAEQSGSIASAALPVDQPGSAASVPQSGSDFREARARVASHPADYKSHYTDNPSKKSCALAIERCSQLHQEVNAFSPLPWKAAESPTLMPKDRTGSGLTESSSSFELASCASATQEADSPIIVPESKHCSVSSSNPVLPEEDKDKKASRVSLSSWWNSEDSPKAADKPAKPDTEPSISRDNTRPSISDSPEGDEKNEVAPAVNPRPTAQTFCMDDDDSPKAMESGVVADAIVKASEAHTPDAMLPTKSAVAETTSTTAESDLQA